MLVVVRKRLGAVTMCAAVLASNAAFSQPNCDASEVEVTNTTALLQNKYLCANRGSDIWQEFHQSLGPLGNALIDWKRGPTDPVDSSRQLGTWAGSNIGVVTHSYTGGASYSWRVCRVGSGSAATYTLRSVAGGVITGATVIAGTSTQTTRPCPPP